MNYITYPYNPINSIPSFARSIGEQTEVVLKTAENANNSYTKIQLRKKDGTPRIVYEASSTLKRMQRKIVDNIFSKTEFPNYLHGCIKSPSSKRSIYSNATPHTGSSSIILLDVADFFPSIKAQHILPIFRKCYGFSPNVSQLLLKLTTLNGFLPQGASTSSYIANLIFWDCEPRLADNLHSKNLNYTRFADDITISKKNIMSSKEKHYAIQQTASMLKKKGCSIKRNKTQIAKRGEGNLGSGSAMIVTSLSVYHKNLSINKRERKEIRATIHQLEKDVKQNKNSENWQQRYDSIMGRVGRLISCKHEEAETYKRRLHNLKSTF
ncbi:reverse transcriptase family protein [Kushneria sp. EE4]